VKARAGIYQSSKQIRLRTSLYQTAVARTGAFLEAVSSWVFFFPLSSLYGFYITRATPHISASVVSYPVAMSSQEVALSGHTLSSSDMSAIADLRNDTAFPSFDSCPSEYDINLEYYHSIDGLFLVPTRHWCLLAEILGASLIIRLRLVIKDKVGKRFPIAFHLEPDDTGLNPLDFRKGYTVAILYPHQHRFLDFTEGIRQDDIKRIQVIPLSLSDILDLSDRVQKQNRQIDGKYGCHACGTRKESLMKCGKCGLARYCDKVKIQPGYLTTPPCGSCSAAGSIVN